MWFREASRWILRCRQEWQPFFCYLALNAPHGPFFVPDKHRRPYASLFNTVPQPGDSAVLWGKWRLVSGGELYEIGVAPG